MSIFPCSVAAAPPKLHPCHLPPPPPLRLFSPISLDKKKKKKNQTRLHFPYFLSSASLPHRPRAPESHPASFPTVRSASLASPASMASSAPSSEPKPFSVLFVCLGNICRSPTAEGVFKSLVSSKGLDSKFKIDSAATISDHEGNPADPRAREASKRRGIELTSLSRPIRPSDFRDFDLILAMDMQNREDILAAYERWSFKEPLPEDAHKKVKLVCSYCKKHKESEVPDPYYGGPQGFEKVLDLLEDACEALLDSILAEKGHISAS